MAADRRRLYEIISRKLCRRKRYFIRRRFTFLGGPETVVARHVLDVVDQGGLGEQLGVLVDLVDGVFERQLHAAVLLVLGEDRAWK